MLRRVLVLSFAAALALTGAACSDDDGSADGADDGASEVVDGGVTTTTAPPTPDPSDADATTTTVDPASTTTLSAADAGGLPADVCALIPDGTVVGGTELVLPTGVPDGNDVRRVCAYPAGEVGGVAVTVGIEDGGRFDEKAEVSRTSLGDDGEPIEGLGDRALYFFSDVDIPEGVGGVLVGIGDRTIDVTVQNLPSGELRPVAEGIAELIVSALGGALSG